jgi:hypothetical protein
MLFQRHVLPFALTVLLGSALPARAQGPGRADVPPARYVAIGCVSREAQKPSARGATRSRYVLTDPRGDRPTTYQLDGDEATLDFHVGHTVEISGLLTVVAGAGRGPNAGALILKVASLTYISTTCEKLPAK